MKNKTFILYFTILLFSSQIIFAQDRGLVNVAVKQNNGRKQNEILYRNSYALLIGNSNYSEWNSLPGVERDIPQIEAVLRDKHNFIVEKAMNLSKNELRSRIDQFISKYGQDYDNRLLIYYAGHGYTTVLPDKRVMGYLVMKDAPIVPPVEEALVKTPKNLGEFRLNAISMDEIENLAKEISTRHALFVFDSCFSGTALYRDNVINIPTEISSEELEPMRGFLTAGNEKQRVRDDSPFRRAFIKGLEGKADYNSDGYILSSELGSYVKREVFMETRNSELSQSPIFGKQFNFTRGDMIFELPKKDSLSQAQIAWNNFREIAKRLLRYDHINTVSEGLAVAHLNKKRGFINLSGDSVVPPNYEVYSFSEGLAPIKLNEKWGFIDKTGNVIIKAIYDKATQFQEGLAIVVSNDKAGYIDKTGKVIIPIKYESAISASEGLLGVGQINEDGYSKSGFIDKTGNTVIPFKYEEVFEFSEGLAPVNFWHEYSKPHCQYIDRLGNVVINLFETHSSCQRFSEGRAAVGIMVGSNDDGIICKWGFIDTKGNKITENIYDEYSDFEDGLSGVVKDKKLGVIDKNGRTILPFKYDDDGFGVFDGLIRVSLNKKIGFFDYRGNEVISLRYDSIWCYAFRKEGFIGVTLNGKKGFVDIYGNEYFDF